MTGRGESVLLLETQTVDPVVMRCASTGIMTKTGKVLIDSTGISPTLQKALIGLIQC